MSENYLFVLEHLVFDLLSCIMILYACQNLNDDQLRYNVVFHNYYFLVSFHLDLLYLSLIFFLVPNSDISQDLKPYGFHKTIFA